MENISGIIKGEDQSQMDLPPGFRFHPTDEELITHYLSKKVFDSNFNAKAIGEADLNKCEPWDLPWRAKMGEKQWYFFCVRDRKYPTGLRTNRATEAGYWKATGKDKAIYRSKSLVGMKKTLVFYKGRAPKGEKTNWVTHEFRLEGKFSPYNHPKTSKNEWVICRIFNKSSGCKKPYVSSLVRLNSLGDEMGHSQLPPLTDSPIYNSKTKLIASETSHVTCFSNSMEDNCFNPPLVSDSSNPSIITNPLSSIFSKISLPNSFYSTQDPPNLVNLQYPNSVLMQDQSIWLALLENQMEHSCKPEREMISISQETGLTTDMNTESSSIVSNLQMGRNSFEDQGDPSTSVEPVDLDCIWNY